MSSVTPMSYTFENVKGPVAIIALAVLMALVIITVQGWW